MATDESETDGVEASTEVTDTDAAEISGTEQTDGETSLSDGAEEAAGIDIEPQVASGEDTTESDTDVSESDSRTPETSDETSSGEDVSVDLDEPVEPAESADAAEEPSDKDENSVEASEADGEADFEASDAADDKSDAETDEQSENLEDLDTGDTPVDETPKETVAAKESTPPPATQSASAGTLVFGGVVAGAVGFAAAYFGLAQQPDPAVGTLTSDVASLRQQIEELSAAPVAEPDLTPILSEIEDVSSQLGDIDTRFETTQGLIDTVNARIDGIESAAAAATLPEGAQEAFASELQAARDEIAAERTELAAMIEEAQASEAAASEAAEDATQRAAISELFTALDTGTPFSEPLNELAESGIDVPQQLMDAGAAGIVPLSDLQQSFPDASRDALSAARAATEGASGFSGFLQTQLGVRSLEPRDGDDPDAILSRAEAALGAGDLTEALAEIETLPPEALSALATWMDDATKRRDALLAAQDLSDGMN